MPARKQTLITPPSTPAPASASLFEVRQSSIQGLGAFALRPIRKGQRIVEYAGERISNDEADVRYDESTMQRHHTFLFTLDGKTVVDGASQGNEAIYINHSCAPNCEAVITGKRIYIHALRAIQPGEELAYDYQYERTGENDDELEKFYACRCGAPTCRGSIMKPAKKPRAAKPGKKATAKKRDTTRKKKASAKRPVKSSSKGTSRGSAAKTPAKHSAKRPAKRASNVGAKRPARRRSRAAA